MSVGEPVVPHEPLLQRSASAAELRALVAGDDVSVCDPYAAAERLAELHDAGRLSPRPAESLAGFCFHRGAGQPVGTARRGWATLRELGMVLDSRTVGREVVPVGGPRARCRPGGVNLEPLSRTGRCPTGVGA
jgi:hypothetical protein